MNYSLKIVIVILIVSMSDASAMRRVVRSVQQPAQQYVRPMSQILVTPKRPYSTSVRFNNSQLISGVRNYATQTPRDESLDPLAKTLEEFAKSKDYSSAKRSQKFLELAQASENDLKRAYMTLIRRYHPDMVARSGINSEEALRIAQNLNRIMDDLQKSGGSSMGDYGSIVRDVKDIVRDAEEMRKAVDELIEKQAKMKKEWAEFDAEIAAQRAELQRINERIRWNKLPWYKKLYEAWSGLK